MKNPNPMDITDFLTDLEGGVFAAIVGRAIQVAAAGTVTHEKNGKVTISLDFAQVASSRQVIVKHTVAYSEPTEHGKATEERTTQTPMYVNQDGSVSLVPASQTDLFKKETDHA